MNFLGGIPVNRNSNTNTVDQISSIFNDRNEFKLAISPEGTRRKVKKWKTGFYYIAKKSNVPIAKYEKYNQHKQFNPGYGAPFNGYCNNIDRESILRNQFFALQAGDQAKYIPPSTSDLYMNSINFETVPVDLEETMLFRQPEFADFNPNPSVIIGNRIFDNRGSVRFSNDLNIKENLKFFKKLIKHKTLRNHQLNII